MTVAARLATEAGADLIVSISITGGQAQWRTGFLEGPSNYFWHFPSTGGRAAPRAKLSACVTRADGDGRVSL
jgi:hypothetical protein